MESFFSRYRHGLFLIAVLLVQVVMLAVQVKRTPNGISPTSDAPTVNLGRYWGASVFGPIERLINGTGHGIGYTWNNYIALTQTQQKNEELQAELDRMRVEQASLADQALQAQRLQALLGFQQQYIYKTVAAQVLATSGTDQSRTFYIDKGEDAGLKPDMPVITPDGIVGKLREIYAHSALVLEINDMTSGAGVVLETTRIRGVLRGNSAGQPQIINVMPDDRIKAGEHVVTSGGDMIFPPGYPVGTVLSVKPDPEHDPYVAVLLKPAADLARLEEVLVIVDQSNQMPPQMQQDIASSESATGNKRAADIVAERLPGLKDPNADPNQPDPTQATGLPPPVNSAPPLRPDHYSPGYVPPATEMTPGGAAPADNTVQQQVAPVHATSTATGTADTNEATHTAAVPAAKPKPAETQTAPEDDTH
jgi:rod shape-determining protein MreC